MALRSIAVVHAVRDRGEEQAPRAPGAHTREAAWGVGGRSASARKRRVANRALDDRLGRRRRGRRRRNRPRLHLGNFRSESVIFRLQEGFLRLQRLHIRCLAAELVGAA
eukprot:scaffold65871_cov51-Phaeocystis_antarctica.AAC.1